MLSNRLSTLESRVPLEGESPLGASRATVRVALSENPSDEKKVPDTLALPLGYRFAKRCLDVLVSGLLLLLLLPAFILIALAVRLSGKGPVLYRSVRVGQGGKRMAFLKFRTMHAGADRLKASLQELNEKSGPIFKLKEDPRVTPVGRFLRKYSLDELPQLVHVLLGDMTLVGPRPHLACEVERYRPEDWARLAVKPGLTCYWQVRGRSDLSFEEWVALDLEYIRDMSLLADLKLLAATPKAVLGGKGAY